MMKKVNPELDPNQEKSKNRPATSNDLQRIEEKIFEHLEDDRLVSCFETARSSLNETNFKLNSVYDSFEEKCLHAHKQTQRVYNRITRI